MLTAEGVYTAIITPFLEDGSLDEEGLIELIDIQMSAGVKGIVVLGTTGETPTLTSIEKKRIIEIARDRITSPFELLVGTGTYSTKTTIEETKKAEALGADGALVVTPYYNKPTQEGLFLHYEALAKATKLPILIYNIQGRTASNLKTETLKRLAEIPSIVGVKEASGNIDQMAEVIDALPKSFKVLSGDDSLTLPLMALGGHGVISVVSNLVPDLIQQLYQYLSDENYKEARALHYKLLPLFKGAFIETNPIPIKALMSFDELPSGPCRLPLCPLSQENAKKLRHLHETLKLPLLAHG